MQRLRNGLACLASPAACLGRLDEIDIQLVMLDLHRYRDFELHRTHLCGRPAPRGRRLLVVSFLVFVTGSTLHRLAYSFD
ncbi:MAG: hypothetical protein KGJ78_16500, partial [Alphaproteobacteria bacterium]|nr:hypothetical protein [Alphaproteobacteria bacterium]